MSATTQGGLFDMARTPLAPGDVVDVGMPWDEVWRCEVVAVIHDGGWPRAKVRRGAGDSFEVDIARCLLVSG